MKEQLQKGHTNIKDYSMFIGAMLIFGTIGIFRRKIGLSSAILACFRGLSGAAFLVLVVWLQKKKIRHGIGKKKVFLLMLTGALIGINWMLLFEAFNFTSVATATLCYYMQPTIVILLAPIFFKEKLTLKKLLCALVAIAGMVLVSGVAETGIPQTGEMKGILCGLGAAAFYAGVVILNKLLTGIDAYEKTIIQLTSAAVVLIPYLLFTQDFSSISIQGSELLMLLIVGFVHTGIAYAMYFGSVDRLKAQTIAIFSYIDPVSALILSALILRENMTVLGIMGAVMILGAAFVSETK